MCRVIMPIMRDVRINQGSHYSGSTVQGDCANNIGCANKPGVTLFGFNSTQFYLVVDFYNCLSYEE